MKDSCMPDSPIRFVPRSEDLFRLEQKRDAALAEAARLQEMITRLGGSDRRPLPAISRALVNLMGGQIHAESRPGEGSLFSFTLPIEIGP